MAAGVEVAVAGRGIFEKGGGSRRGEIPRYERIGKKERKEGRKKKVA